MSDKPEWCWCKESEYLMGLANPMCRHGDMEEAHTKIARLREQVEGLKRMVRWYQQRFDAAKLAEKAEGGAP